MDTTLLLPQIREKLIEELEGVLAPQGHKVKNRKGENSFVKKTGNGYFKLQFFYEKYHPIDYKVYFVFRCRQDDITEVMTSFFTAMGKPALGPANIIFSEGNFVEGMRDKQMKYRLGYKNRLVTDEDLEDLCRRYKDLVQHIILPLEEQLATMEGTARYLYAHRNLLAGNYAMESIITSLITLQKTGSADYEDLYRYYMAELPREQERYGVMATRPLQAVEDLHKYLADKG